MFQDFRGVARPQWPADRPVCMHTLLPETEIMRTIQDCENWTLSRSKTGNRRVARGRYQNVGPEIYRGPEGGSESRTDIDRAFETAFSIDDLAALGGFHTTTKTALAKLLNTTLTRIFHSLRS